MFLTLKELEDRINRAKTQLVSGATRWLATQRQPSGFDGEGWLFALQAENRTTMNELIQECGLPLEYSWTEISVAVSSSLASASSSNAIEHLGELANSEELIIIPRSIYIPSVTYPFISAVGQMTTFMEQLFLLEEQLLASDLRVNFKELNLVEEMLNSIRNELRYAVPGRETTDYYRQRLMQPAHIFNESMSNNNNTLGLWAKQLDYKFLLFKHTLEFLVNSLQDSFALVPDQRSWVIQLFSAYRPWQLTLKQLALEIFGGRAISHPIANQMVISNQFIALATEHFRIATIEPINKIREELEQKAEDIQEKMTLLSNTFGAMSQRLDILQRLMGRPVTAVGLLPTQTLPLHRFFQGLQSVYGTQGLQLRLTAEHSSVAEEHEEEQQNYSMN